MPNVRIPATDTQGPPPSDASFIALLDGAAQTYTYASVVPPDLLLVNTAITGSATPGAPADSTRIIAVTTDGQIQSHGWGSVLASLPSEVVANPSGISSGTPLNFIAIGTDNYEIVGGSGGSLPSNLQAFAGEMNIVGETITLTDNVFVNPINITGSHTQTLITGGEPLTLTYRAVRDETGGTSRSVNFGDQPIVFTNAPRSGSMNLRISTSTNQQSGHQPALTSLVMSWPNGVTLTFPLENISVLQNTAVDIPIEFTAPSNIAGILNVQPTLTLNFDFRGAAFAGGITIYSLMNDLTGTLYQAVVDVATEQAGLEAAQVNKRIDNLTFDGVRFDQLVSRISPITEVTEDLPLTGFRLTFGATQPTTLAGFDILVSPDNPTFAWQATGSLWIAVPTPSVPVLKNTSTDPEIEVPLTSPIASKVSGRQVYFVYNVSQPDWVAGADISLVNRAVTERALWDVRSAANARAIARLLAIDDHGALNIPPEVLSILQGSSVTQSDSVVLEASNFNLDLPTAGQQSIFEETNENQIQSGVRTSRPWSETSGDQTNRGLAVFDVPPDYTSQTFFQAGSQPIISARDGRLYAIRYVPPVPATSQQVTNWLTTSTGNGIAGTWVSLTAATRGHVAEANELFLDQNLPAVATDVTIEVRTRANGLVYSPQTITLSGVGGATDTSATYFYDTGSESVTLTAEWRHLRGDVRVLIQPNVHSGGLAVIAAVEFRAHWTAVQTSAVRPATTDEVLIANIRGAARLNVVGLEVDGVGNLLISGNTAQVNTRWNIAQVLGAGRTKPFSLANPLGKFFRFEGFDPFYTIIRQLESVIDNDYWGLFTATHTVEDHLVLPVTLEPHKLDLSATTFISEWLDFSTPHEDPEIHSVDHNLGRRPLRYDIEIICRTAEHGYSVGDAVILYDGVTSHTKFTLKANDTKLSVAFDLAVALKNRSGSDIVPTDITLANWQFRFRASLNL